MGILIVGRVEKDGISSCFFCRSPMNCYFRSPNTGVQFVLSTFHPEIKTLKLSLISPKEPGSRMDGTSEIKKIPRPDSQKTREENNHIAVKHQRFRIFLVVFLV